MATIIDVRRLCLFALPFVCLPVIAQQNTETKLIEQQSNGVKIYEQSGVQSTNHSVQIEEPREVRTLNDWTIDECELAIDQISEKIAHFGEAEEYKVRVDAYREEIERIKKHLSTITSK